MYFKKHRRRDRAHGEHRMHDVMAAKTTSPSTNGAGKQTSLRGGPERASAQQAFNTFLKKFPSGVTPGFQVQAYLRGEKIIDSSWGTTFKYYDLASLTKILFSLPLAMKAVEEKRLRLSDPISNYVPWINNNARVEQVLTHTAGNAWWQPFYESLNADRDIEFKKHQLRLLIRAQKPKTIKSAVYSDIDFFILGFILENVFGKNWFALWNDFQSQALKVPDLFFHVENERLHSRTDYAPTEQCGWRRRLLQGEVHDENAHALGGVAPHAGLFGTVNGLSEWGLWLRSVWRGESDWLSAATLKTFAKRAVPPRRGDWGLGFMLPTQGSASCGSYFSPQSFGHTGFTGTSFWFDPRRDLFVSLVSNRVHPTRANEHFRYWRPKIHDAVVMSLKDLA